MTQHDELADYMATGMKDYQRGVSLFKNLGINTSDNLYFETDNPSKIQINLLNQKLTYYAKIKNIRPRRIITVADPAQDVPERPDIPVSEPVDYFPKSAKQIKIEERIKKWILTRKWLWKKIIFDNGIVGKNYHRYDHRILNYSMGMGENGKEGDIKTVIAHYKISIS